MKVLSLFSGIGAFEKALTNRNIKYEVVGFSEIDKWAIESYCAVHGVDKSLSLGDVSKINLDDIPDADLVTYGFPCQDISTAGLQKGINAGTRSGLLYEAEKIINKVQPEYAIAENVKNLVGKRHKKDFNELLKRLEGYGYNNYYKVLNSKDFEIPQNRERVFIVSIRKDVDDNTFQFPNPKKLKRYLGDVVLDKVEDKYYIDNKYTKETLVNLANLENKNECNDNNIIVLGNYHKSNYDASRIVSKLGIAPTVKENHGTVTSIIQDGKVRKLTPEEFWLLMGFTKDDYWLARRKLEEVFYSGGDRSNSQMYKQGGNSIVVDVLEGIYKELLEG